jgi:hypothetical protein
MVFAYFLGICVLEILKVEIIMNATGAKIHEDFFIMIMTAR